MAIKHKRLLGAIGMALTCVMPSLHAEDKTLRLYNWADYFAEDTLSRFTAETGIKVIYDVMDGSETLEAKMLSGGSGYDLIFPGDTVAERLMRAGSLMPLDQAKLTELADIEPGLQKLRSHYEHSSKATVPYTWGTIGLTYNEEQIKQRMADAPVNSLDMLFKPELAAKFADCGISMIDSPDEALAVVLNYLGRDPRSGKAEDLAAASELLMKLRPYIRKFQSQPVTDLVNGNLCLSLGYSGDMTQAQRTSDSAGKHTRFQYRVPREGTTVWMDTMAIPVDAKHPEYAYAFINFVMRPENMAAISNFTGYLGHQVEAGRGLGVFQEGDVLEVVHVDIAGGQADVGRDPVGELHQLDFQALSYEEVAYLGDDLPDLPVIRRVGLGMAVANAADFVREHAHGVTRARGGEGAAREFCELILRAQGRLDAANAAYL